MIRIENSDFFYHSLIIQSINGSFIIGQYQGRMSRRLFLLVLFTGLQSHHENGRDNKAFRPVQKKGTNEKPTRGDEGGEEGRVRQRLECFRLSCRFQMIHLKQRCQKR